MSKQNILPLRETSYNYIQHDSNEKSSSTDIFKGAMYGKYLDNSELAKYIHLHNQDMFKKNIFTVKKLQNLERQIDKCSPQILKTCSDISNLMYNGWDHNSKCYKHEPNKIKLNCNILEGSLFTYSQCYNNISSHESGISWGYWLKNDILFIGFKGSTGCTPLISDRSLSNEISLNLNRITKSKSVKMTRCTEDYHLYALEEIKDKLKNINSSNIYNFKDYKSMLEKYISIGETPCGNLNIAKNKVLIDKLLNPGIHVSYAETFLAMNNISNEHIPPVYFSNLNTVDFRPTINGICGMKKGVIDENFIGFLNEIKKINKCLKNGIKNIVLTGHSRGASMSTLATHFINIDLELGNIPTYTYIFSPIRLGNLGFRKIFNKYQSMNIDLKVRKTPCKTYRFTYWNDRTCNIPGFLGIFSFGVFPRLYYTTNGYIIKYINDSKLRIWKSLKANDFNDGQINKQQVINPRLEYKLRGSYLNKLYTKPNFKYIDFNLDSRLIKLYEKTKLLKLDNHSIEKIYTILDILCKNLHNSSYNDTWLNFH